MTFVLIHGAGSTSWYWHLVAPLLASAGHEVIAVDLPSHDDSAGLNEYADVVVDAILFDKTDVVLVAQSLGGFTAPSSATASGTPFEKPSPRIRPPVAGRRSRDLVLARPRSPAGTSPLGAWPDVPTRFLPCRLPGA